MGNENFVVNINQTWPVLGKIVLIGIFIFAVLVILVLVFSEFFKDLLRRQKKTQSSLFRFNEHCALKRLKPNEKSVLQKMLSALKVSNYDEVFSSLHLFEQCVENELEKMKKQGLSEDRQVDFAETLAAVREKLGYRDLPMERPLLSSREIPRGQAAEIEVDTGGVAANFKTTIMDVDELKMTLKVIEEEGEFPEIKKGNKVLLSLTRPGDAEYHFPTEILDAGRGTVKLFSVKHCRSVERNQLRNDVRMDVNFPVRYRIIRTKEGELDKTQRDAQMIDVSGGGMSLKSAFTATADDVVSLNFNLGSSAFRGVASRVLRVIETKSKDGQVSYKYHVQFVNLEEHNKEKIIRYIFEKQREVNQWR